MYSSRITPVIPTKTTVLLVDVQNSEINSEHERNKSWYFEQINQICLPNMKRIIEVARSLGMEIMYTTIESLTRDGRDRSLDHKLSDILIPKGSSEAHVIAAVAPAEDDIWLRKTSSGVFNSTNIDYILRNLSMEFLVVMGFLTDQCVDMAVRDAADKGYQVICISDACTTHSQERHDNALRAFGGYCRVMTTSEFLKDIQDNNHREREKVQESIPSLLHPAALTMLVTTDLTGITRGRSIPTISLDDYWVTGCGWVPADSALTPQNVVADPNPWGSQGDLRLLPDRHSRVLISNGPNLAAPALDFIHCDLIETNGTPWDVCPRGLLHQEIQRYRDSLGMQISAAFEHEFTLSGRESLGDLPAFSLRAQRHVADFGSWLMAALKTARVEPEMFLPEYGRRQYEVTCRPAQGIIAADRAVNVREITREIAQQMSLYASFSPKTAVNAVSNGVHLHLSIQDLDGKPLLYQAGRRYELSEIGEYWAAGVLHHLPALCALTAPTPVSYLGLKSHQWSAAYACVGYRNREAALRICPTVTMGSKSVAEQYNLEYRPLDSTASPHFSMATILIAGRLGIEQQLSLDAVSDIDPHELRTAEREARNIAPLPSNLTSALELLSKDEELMQILPKSLTETYFAVKHQEISLTRGATDEALCEQYARLY